MFRKVRRVLCMIQDEGVLDYKLERVEKERNDLLARNETLNSKVNGLEIDKVRIEGEKRALQNDNERLQQEKVMHRKEIGDLKLEKERLEKRIQSQGYLNTDKFQDTAKATIGTSAHLAGGAADMFVFVASKFKEGTDAVQQKMRGAEGTADRNQEIPGPPGGRRNFN